MSHMTRCPEDKQYGIAEPLRVFVYHVVHAEIVIDKSPAEGTDTEKLMSLSQSIDQTEE
jgi:hypothetical protein